MSWFWALMVTLMTLSCRSLRLRHLREPGHDSCLCFDSFHFTWVKDVLQCKWMITSINFDLGDSMEVQDPLKGVYHSIQHSTLSAFKVWITDVKGSGWSRHTNRQHGWKSFFYTLLYMLTWNVCILWSLCFLRLHLSPSFLTEPQSFRLWQRRFI